MKKIIFLVFIIVVCSFTITGICLANQKDAFPNFTEENKSEEVPKPELGEDYLENEFDAPNIEEHQKQWYEYVGFDMENPKIQNSSKFIYNIFMPEDSDLATVMEISGLSMSASSGDFLFGNSQKIDGLDQFTTASSILVDYTIQNSRSDSLEASLVSEITVKEFIAEERVSAGITSTISLNEGETATFSRTFNAIPEANGTIVPWQVVKYDVQMAVFVRVYKKNDYRLYKEGYLMLNLMSGVCRRWANGYIEHWRTGEKVVIEDFMGENLSPESLKNQIQKNGLF